MRFKKWVGILIGILMVLLGAQETVTFAYQKVDLPGIRPQNNQGQLIQVEFITPEELKTKIAKNETLAIVDLRAQSSFEQSDKKIKGSFHTRVRKVSYQMRLVPRDREVIIYCACPADEAAILAARSLLGSGFKRVRVLKGGWNAWLQGSGQVQAKPKGL